MATLVTSRTAEAQRKSQRVKAVVGALILVTAILLVVWWFNPYRGYEKGKQYVGTLLSEPSVKGAKECKEACNKDAACAGVTYNPKADDKKTGDKLGHCTLSNNGAVKVSDNPNDYAWVAASPKKPPT